MEIDLILNDLNLDLIITIVYNYNSLFEKIGISVMQRTIIS